MPLEIAVPFHVSEDGKVDTLSDPDDQIRQHVVVLVNTTPGERVMLPTYGVDSLSVIFEDADADEVAMQVSTMITQAFTDWEPGVKLLSVSSDDTFEDEIAQVDVQYQRRDSVDTNSAANSNEAIIGADGTVKEMVRG